jgi:hypothetical protein
MSVTLIFPYATYAAGATVTLDNATETALVGQGRATFVANPGTSFAPLTPVEQQTLRYQSVSLAAGSIGVGPANTIALIGDSRIANGFSTLQTQQQGYFTNLNALLGDRFSVLGFFAAGGKTLDNVLADQVPQVLALNPRPAFAFMECGHNDIAPSLGNKTAAATITSWQAVRDALAAGGVALIGSTSLPSNLITTAAALKHLATYNRYLMAQNGVQRGVMYFDGHAAAVDPATGQFLAALTYDSVHANYQGAWNVARVGFAMLDQIIPKYPRFTSQPNNYSQLVINPTGNGSAGTIAGGATGTPPTSWAATSAGAGAAAISKVARSDFKTGEVTRLTFSAGTVPGDYIAIEGGRPQLRAWAANTARVLNERVKPSTANGRHYIVTTAGTSANAADPTGGWSTTVGAVVTDGGQTLLCVESIDVGDTVEFVAEIAAQNFNGAVGSIRLELEFRTSGSALISTAKGNYADATYTLPSSAVQTGLPVVLRTLPFVVPATTAFYVARVLVMAQLGAVVDIGCLELQKR